MSAVHEQAVAAANKRADEAEARATAAEERIAVLTAERDALRTTLKFYASENDTGHRARAALQEGASAASCGG